MSNLSCEEARGGGVRPLRTEAALGVTHPSRANRQPPIHPNLVPADVRSRGTGEKQRELGDFFGFAEAPERNAGEKLLHGGALDLRRQSEFGLDGGVDDAGADGVDADLAGAELDGEAGDEG